MNVERSIIKVSIEMVIKYPFFATLLLPMERVITTKVRTAATDGVTLFINPKFWESLNFKERMFLLVHEVMHPAMLHHTRRNGRDMKMWNMACDYAINPLIVENGLPMPARGLLDARFANMSAEQIYRILLEEQEDQDEGESGSEAGGSGTESGDSHDTSSTDDEDEEEDDVEESGEGGESDEDEEDADTQPSDNEVDQWEPGDGVDDGWGDVMDFPGDTHEERVEHEAAMIERVQHAHNASQKAGKGVGGVEELLNELREPKVHWADHLQRLISEKTRDDYSWRRPNRRYMGNGFILPGLDGDTYGEVTLMIDTSGSLGRDELNEIASEVAEIYEFTNSAMRVIYCDYSVRKVDEFEPDDELILEAKGGGGTDFRPPFEYLEEEEISPRLSIYFTDGWCSSFPEAPDHDVIWALSTPKNRINFDPPFGEVIYIN